MSNETAQGPIHRRIPDGDNRERLVCNDCGFVHYSNPKVMVGSVVHWEENILLCRREIEPRAGFWTLPAGFMENGETTEEAALRETWEEARARLQQQELYMLFNLPHINQVYMFFRGELADLEFSAGEESLEVRLFHEHEIPWDKLAFPTVGKTLKQYFLDRQEQAFPVRIRDILYRPGQHRR